MATYTPNLGLRLPDYNEDADISVFNENMRLIDEKLILATASVAGLVMPDNETLIVNADGSLTVIGGGSGSGGTSGDFNIATEADIIEIINNISGESTYDDLPETVTVKDATAYSKGIVRPDNLTIFVERGVLSANQYTLQPATSRTLGGIQVGNNLTIDQDGVLNTINTVYTLPVASPTVLGGIKIDNKSIVVDQYGVARVNFTDLVVPVATNDTLGIVRAGENITIDSNGYLSAILPETYKLPIATLSKLGGVIPDGQSIEVTSRGVIKVPYATENTYGIIKPDNVSTVVENGIISAIQSVYELPIASNEVLGGVKIDNTSITINEEGIISANFDYAIPIATNEKLGGVMPDNETIKINNRGVLSTAFSPYVLPLATKNSLGGVKIDDDTITMNAEGHISANTRIASTSSLGSVMVDGRTIVVDALGTLTVKTAYVLPEAKSTTLGGVKINTEVSPLYLTDNYTLSINLLDNSGLMLEYDEDLGYCLVHENTGSGTMASAGYQDGTSLPMGGNITFPYIIFDKFGHEKSVSNRAIVLPGLSDTFRQEIENNGNYTIHLKPATASKLGGIIASNNSFTITNSGILNVKETTDNEIDLMLGSTVINPDGTIGTMPKATKDVIGGIRVGNNLEINGDGVLSVNRDMVSANSVYESGIELGSITINGETVTFFIPDYEYADGMEY